MKSKITTMKSRQEIEDEDIQRYMNFNKLLEEKEKFVIRKKKVRNLRIAAVAVGTLFIGIALVFLLRTPATDKTKTDRVSTLPAQEKMNQTATSDEPVSKAESAEENT